MSGGMTHLDTFDPKPGTETGGHPIHQNKGGWSTISRNLPLLANHADKIAVVRGMTSTKGAHQRETILCIQVMHKDPQLFIRAWVHG